jgi:hypothetical protein
MNVDSKCFPESICTPESGSGRASQAAAILKFECHQRECNSVSFLSVVPKKQIRTHISIV